jgi:hypothetical protein
VLAKLVVTACPRAPLHHRSGGNGAEITEFHIAFDRREGTDCHSHSKAGVGVHGGQRMNAQDAPVVF